MAAAASVWRILFAIAATVAKSPAAADQVSSTAGEISTASVEVPSAAVEVSDEDGAAEPRRTLAEVHYTFGISVTSQGSKFKNPDGTETAQPCWYCSDALSGLKYWRSFINEMGSFNTMEGYKRIYVKFEAMDDNGDFDTMKANYEYLADPANRDANSIEMIALFGPFYFGWNEAAAAIAAKHNMVIILWAFEYWNYMTFPGPEKSALTAGITPAQSQGPPGTRRLEKRKSVHPAKGSCSSDGFGVCNEESKQEWEPGVVFRKDSHGNEWRETRELSEGQHGRLLEGIAVANNFGQAPQFVPCSENEWMSYPVSFECNPETVPDEGTPQFPVSLTLEPSTHTIVTAMPKGAEFFAVTVQNADGDAVDTSYSWDIWSVDSNGEPSNCLFAPSWSTSLTASNIPSCYRYEPCETDQLTPCAVEFEGVSGEWTASTTNVFEFYTEKLTGDIAIQVRNPSTTDAITVNVLFSYSRIDPCPAKTYGCRPCKEYVGCSAGLFNACNGSAIVDCVQEPNPDGEVWSYGYRNVFDINLPTTSWPLDAIDQVYASGARKLIFIYMLQEVAGELASQMSWERQCTKLANYGAALAGTEVLLYRIEETAEFMRDMRFLRAEEGDAFIHCGRISSMVLFTMGAKAFGLQAKAFISDRPFGYYLVNTTKGFNSNYFMEPLAMKFNISKDCAIYGSYGIWKEGYEKKLKKDNEKYEWSMGYAGMQTAAMGVLMTEAIRTLEKAALTSQEGLIAWLRSVELPTFFGNLSFDEIGQRRARQASTRQFRPIPEGNYADVVRYESSDIEVVDLKLAPSLDYVQTRYDIPGWIEKELQVYPCTSGCFFHNHQCVPCGKGTYRDHTDIDCRPCETGTYADVEGLDACRECPKGAVCDPTNLVAKEKYFAMSVSGNQSDADDATYEFLVSRECVNPHRILNTTVYEACRPTSVCKGGLDPCAGSNMGLLCGQCGIGQSYFGFMSGRRMCHDCPPKARIVIQCILLFVLYAGIGKFFEACALRCHAEAASLSCAILRCLFHFMHVLGIVLESTRIDSSRIVAGFAIPFEILIRPLETIEIDCLRDEPSTSWAIKDYTRLSLILIPVVLGSILAWHVVEGLFGYLKVFLRAIPGCISAIVKALLGGDQAKRKSDESGDGHGDHNKVDPAPPLGMENVIGKSPPEPEAIKENGAEAEGSGRFSLRNKRRQIFKPRDDKWSKIVGPGAAFASMHEGFELQEHLRAYLRECIVALIFLYPIVLRQIRRATACAKLKGFEGSSESGLDMSMRMVTDFDIVCGSSDYEDVVGHAGNVYPVVFVAMPVLILLTLLYLRHECFDLEWRRITQALFDGYCPDKAYWEVIMFLRTGFTIEAAFTESLSGRCLLMLLVMVVCLCVQIELRPYEFRDREVLHFFELLGMISIIVTIVAGMICQYELDKDLSESWDFSDAVKNCFLALVVFMNAFTILYGFAALTFNSISLPLQAIINANTDLSVDVNAKRFDKFVRKTFRGMNPVGYFTRNGRHFIDVSQLDEGERNFLVLSLTETMGACFDSGSKIHTWLLENAIHEAFDRAFQARSALVRNLYQTHGGRPFALFNFMGFIKLFRVNIRPPDIPASQNAADHKAPGQNEQGEIEKMVAKGETIVHEAEKIEKQGEKVVLEAEKVLEGAATKEWMLPRMLPKESKAKGEKAKTGYSLFRVHNKKEHVAIKGHGQENEHKMHRHPDKDFKVHHGEGVTVEELHNALASVNVDVLERNPNIHKPLVTDSRDQESRKDQDHMPDHYALTWNPGASLSVFEDYAKTWGSLNISKKKNFDSEKRQPDDELWDDMIKESNDHAQHSDYAVQERELEETYAMMNEEIMSLTMLLKDAEARDGDQGIESLGDITRTHTESLIASAPTGRPPPPPNDADEYTEATDRQGLDAFQMGLLGGPTPEKQAL